MGLPSSPQIRPARFAGRSYNASPDSLSAQFAAFFRHPEGSGTPSAASREASPKFRGVLSPHIDFHRGGPTYTWAYRELIERSDADVFVIFGVSHLPSRQRFVLTRMDYDTPFGPVETDRGFVDGLVRELGTELLDDSLHVPEHSIEFQAVLLKYALGGRRPFAIVPILVGSFHDLMVAGVDPIDDPAVSRFVEALRAAERSCGKKVAYIGGIDLCHVGPEFGDRSPVDDVLLSTIEKFDRSMLERVESNDPAGWFRAASLLKNRYRVCGLSATYTMLHAMGPSRGRLLRYRQSVDASRTCCVSFASVVFDEE